MTSRDFCYWLQGYFEIGNATGDPVSSNLTSGQVECIRNHLNMVFRHEIDPGFGKDLPDLTKLHKGDNLSGVIDPPNSGILTTLITDLDERFDKGECPLGFNKALEQFPSLAQ